MQRLIARTYGLGLGLLIALALLGGTGHAVRAQDGGGDDPLDGDVDSGDLTLFSADDAFPVLFQALAPGEAVDALQLQARITLSEQDRADAPLVYLVIENTGWSEGTLGLLSDRLDANADYVALEVRDRGMPGYAVREDGQGLLVPLVYDPDLGPDGEPGFRLHLVLGSLRSFRIFRVVDEGLMLFAQQNVMVNDGRVQERTIVTIDPDPVFGELVLEAHIEARNLPNAVPEAAAGDDTDGDGVPDAEDTCPQDWGSLPNGCMAHQPGAASGALAINMTGRSPVITSNAAPPPAPAPEPTIGIVE